MKPLKSIKLKVTSVAIDIGFAIGLLLGLLLSWVYMHS